MEKKMSRVTIERFYETLRGLSYYNVKVQERRSEWRRHRFHLHMYPWGKRGLKLVLHEDLWKGGAPVFSHVSISEGEDLKRELTIITKTYRQRK